MIAARHMLTIRPQVASDDPANWLDQSACAEIGPGLWDDQPVEGPRQKERREESAKAICAGCPVKSACLAHAVAHRMRGGIWGGLTEAERDATAPAPVAVPEPPQTSCGKAIGTDAGMRRHSRRHEPGCTACRAAASQAKAERKARRRGESIRARDYMARAEVAS